MGVFLTLAQKEKSEKRGKLFPVNVRLRIFLAEFCQSLDTLLTSGCHNADPNYPNFSD